jgi:hypothetical protein
MAEYSAALNPEFLELTGFGVITLYIYMRIMYIM